MAIQLRALWYLLALVPLAGACGPTSTRTTLAANAHAESATDFERKEAEILRDLAAIDGRIALRARVQPSEGDLRRVSMAAMLREDPTVRVVEGRVDAFSFDARARGLESAAQKVKSIPPTPEIARSEHNLLTRLVEEELVRLEEERALPRSASALVRAVVDTWTAPQGAED
ncbi:MAG TPA: hypothetical protein VM580_10195, partial [Labilithrix sp.]|nr:hypothetical protein [Labilithrix sp.]